MTDSLTLSLKAFDELRKQELYELLRLRQRVFVLEQHCPYVDADNKDQAAWHLLGRDASSQHLLAYARLLPAGLAYPGYASIGRVVTAPEARGKGLGRAIMNESLKACRRLFGRTPIKIMAQEYLLDFYREYGFIPASEPYLEDDILHLDMVREWHA